MQRLAVLFLALLTLVGCSTPERSPSLPPLSSLSRAASGVPSSPPPASVLRTTAAPPPVARPAAASAPDREGAAAFARYWIDVLNATYVTMNTTTLSSISSANCKTCQNYIRSIVLAGTLGQHYSGGEINVSSAVTAPVDTDGASVLINYDANEGKAFGKDGELVLDVPGSQKGTIELQAARQGDEWQASEVLLIR